MKSKIYCDGIRLFVVTLQIVFSINKGWYLIILVYFLCHELLQKIPDKDYVI